MKKILIFDCDGVLLNLWNPMKNVYEDYINKKMSESEWNAIIVDFLHDPRPYKDFGDFFENSEWFDKLPVLDSNMISLIQKFKSDGYELAIVTAASNNDTIANRRAKNVEKIYGEAFSKIICVGRNGSKEEEIKKLSQGYDFSLFIDDSLKNVAKAVGAVTHPVWYENEHHLFQLDQINPIGIHIIKDAKELEALIIQQN